MNKHLKIEKSRQFLKSQGYYTDNLWQIDDVKAQFPNYDDETCMEILDRIMQNERIIMEINETIQIIEEDIRNEL